MRSVTFGIPQRRLDWLLDQYAGEIARRRRSLAALAVIAVHYAAALRYAPDRAAFTDFDPFWEFVAGPINAGTFGPNEVDMTFGPEVKFVSVPENMKQNRSPFDGLQFYGIGRINGENEILIVSLHDVAGKRLYLIDLEPQT